MQIRALIFDLDGTAMASRLDALPSPAVVRAVREAQKHCHVSVASGRPYPYAKAIIEALGISDLCILSGGAVLYSVREGKNVWSQQMDPEAVAQVLYPLKNFVGSHLTENDAELYVKIPLGEFTPTVPMNLFCIYAVTKPQADRIRELVSGVSGFAAHTMNSWTPGSFDVHITHELATKKHAMQALLGHLGVRHDHAMVVGDGGNDLPLFELAGLKVAMGNAAQELKAHADWIAPPVDEDGLAKAIERYILNPVGV